MRICVDASLVAKWLVREEDSDIAYSLWKRFENEGAILIAPTHLDYEIGTILRRKLMRGAVTLAEVYNALEFYHQLNLQLFHLTDLIIKALALAETLQQPTIYDVGYLLVAQHHKADFVTADLRFCRATQGLFPFVKYFHDL